MGMSKSCSTLVRRSCCDRNKADLKLSPNSEEAAKIPVTMDDAHNLDCLNRPFVRIRYTRQMNSEIARSPE
jgi:hypothetical protein